MPSVYVDDAFLRQLTQRADGIAGGHVAHVGEVLTRQKHRNRLAVRFVSVLVHKRDKRFRQTAANMLLGEIERAYL